MGQACGKSSMRDGGDIHNQDGRDVYSGDVQRLADEEPAVVGSWQVPSKPPPVQPPLLPNFKPNKREKKSKAKKDKEKKGFMGTLEGWSSFGSFNASMNERQGRDKRVGILGFEVANLVMKMMNLRMSLFEDELARFKEEVIQSEASKKLISEDEGVLWTIAALDRRRDLSQLMTDVARLGKRSVDPEIQQLDQRFARLGSEDEVRPKLSPSEVDANIDWLQEQIASTADLYHELLALDTLSASLRRAQAEEEQFPGTQKENLAALKQEAKEQERLVRGLKKKGLWSKKLDHILEVLVELIHALHEQLIDAFYPDVDEETLRPNPKNTGEVNELGSQGLSLHYASIISAIDRMVSRPNSVSPASRDALYQMLPKGIKAALREEISKPLEDDSIAGLRRNLDVILDVVTPVAGNTVRWCSDRRLQGHSDLCLMQTLHHADQPRTEALLLELVVSLHHLMSRAKNPLNPSGKSPNRTPSRSPMMTPPRAFSSGGGTDDVALALEEIPAHLRVEPTPSLTDRAESILSKLDAMRTDSSVRIATKGRVRKEEVSEKGLVGKSNGALRKDALEIPWKAKGVRLQTSNRAANGLPNKLVETRGTDGHLDEREEADGVSSDVPSMKSSGGVGGVMSDAHGMTSPGGVRDVPSLPQSNGVPARPSGEDGITMSSGEGPIRTHSEEGTPADVRVDVDNVSRKPTSRAVDEQPGWGLGLLKKSMSARLEAEKLSQTGGDVEGGRRGGMRYPGHEHEGLCSGLDSPQKGELSRLSTSGENDSWIQPKGWHPADRILEGANGVENGVRSSKDVKEGGSGLAVNHTGSTDEGSRSRHLTLTKEQSPSSEGIHGRLRKEGSSQLSSNHEGLREGLTGDRLNTNQTWSRQEESPGLSSEASLGEGIGDASVSDLNYRSSHVPSDSYGHESAFEHGLNGHGLQHGFGSTLQIDEEAAERSEDGIVDLPVMFTQRTRERKGELNGHEANHGATAREVNHSSLSGAPVPDHYYPGDSATLTHRSSDPGALAPKPQSLTPPPRRQSYSGPPDPPPPRRSRFSTEGPPKVPDARGLGENKLHVLVPPPLETHSGELRQSQKHSRELRSPQGSKESGPELLISPRGSRWSSPNSRSASRKGVAEWRSPGQSFSSPRSREPLSPSGVIDIDLIDI